MLQGIDFFVVVVLLFLGVNMLLLIVLLFVDFFNLVEWMQVFFFVYVIVFDSWVCDISGIDWVEVMLMLVCCFWGMDWVLVIFSVVVEVQGKFGYLLDLMLCFLFEFECELVGIVGVVIVVVLMVYVVGCGDIMVVDLMEVVGEVSQVCVDKQCFEIVGEDLVCLVCKLQEVNEKLIKFLVQKDVFLGQISYELCMLMILIWVFLEILMELLFDVDCVCFVIIIYDEVVCMICLIEDLLDFVVFEVGQVRLILCVVNLYELIEWVLVFVCVILLGCDFVVLCDIVVEQIMVMIDVDWLLQVLLNVILNVCKYCDVVVLQIVICICKCCDGVIQIDIVDNGVGILLCDWVLIFEKFLWFDDLVWVGGVGLGLVICCEIMEFLGGLIVYFFGQGGVVFCMILLLCLLGIGGDEVKKVVWLIIQKLFFVIL